MSPRASLLTQMGVVILVLAVWNLDLVTAVEKSLNRQKRGFREGAANRVAHGYGKRGFLSLTSSGSGPLDETRQRPDELLLPKTELSDFLTADEDDGSLASVKEFTYLLLNHPSLAQAVVKKFIDIDRDGMITTSELFRPTGARK